MGSRIHLTLGVFVGCLCCIPLGCGRPPRIETDPARQTSDERNESSHRRASTARVVTEIGAPARQGASLPEDRLAGDWSIAPAAKVTVDLHRTPIRKVLDQMAQQGKLNIVPADELKGEITLKLRDTPWRAALSAICLALDLVAAREGNVIRVVPREAWLKEVGP